MTDWTDHAACHGRPTSWWYPGRGDTFSTEVALSICRACPVRRQCLAETLEVEGETGERYGIFGALTPSQRDQVARTTRTRVKVA